MKKTEMKRIVEREVAKADAAEQREYMLDDALTTATALLADLTRITVRAALKNGLSGDTRAQLEYKVGKLKEALLRIPETEA